MKFQATNHSVECIRITPNSQQSVIACFDERLDAAPPHVRAKLFKSELLELAEWLKDRESIKDAPTEHNLLCLLPSLMDEAIAAMDKIHTISEESYFLLICATEKFHEKLLNDKTKINNKRKTLNEITHTEANKERIKHVMDDLL